MTMVNSDLKGLKRQVFDNNHCDHHVQKNSKNRISTYAGQVNHNRPIKHPFFLKSNT